MTGKINRFGDFPHPAEFELRLKKQEFIRLVPLFRVILI